jgi:hypothetical protein
LAKSILDVINGNFETSWQSLSETQEFNTQGRQLGHGYHKFTQALFPAGKKQGNAAFADSPETLEESVLR